MFIDVEYRYAHRVVRRLLRRCNPAPLVVWGVFLYPFRWSMMKELLLVLLAGAFGTSIEAFASPAHTGGVSPDVGDVLSGVRL